MRTLLFGCAITLAFGLSAQTGPGGVGNSSSNVLWLDANSGVTAPTLGVSAWADRSGNNNNASQSTANLQPVYLTNTANGYPVIQFDNDEAAADYLRIPDNSTLEGMSGLTAFCVYRLATGTVEGAPRGFFSKRNGPDNQEAFSWFLYNGGSGTSRAQYLDIDGTGNRVGSSVSFATGTTYLTSFVYSGGVTSNNQDQVLYNGNTAVGNAVETSQSVPNYSSDLYVGILRGHTGASANTTRFNGWMSEVIIYNQALTSAQRIIVNNYLAAKYGTTIATNDLYAQDDAGNGDYDHNVAGIGRISSSDLQTDSRGSSLVQIRNATDLNDGEFMFWGSDNGAANTWGATGDYPAGLEGRMSRVWRVSEVNTSNASTDVGGVDVIFHLSGFTSVNSGQLRLLVDANNNGVFADDAPISGCTYFGSQQYRFSNVTALSNGLRFTLGTIANGPLPIELVSFDATNDGKRVVLNWTTATEQNNDHFTIERSTDAVQWIPTAYLAGAGNSQNTIDYVTLDEAPVQGISYYRLRQTDFDGTSTLSSVRAIERRGIDQFLPVPNPASDVVQLTANSVEPFTLVDVTGRVVLSGSSDRAFNVSELPNGLYQIRRADGSAVPLMVRH